MELNSHNLSIQQIINHYDSAGNKTKSIYYPSEEIIGKQSNIELTLYEKDGTVKEYFEIPFRSFTNNFMYLWYVRHTTYNSYVNLKTTNGANVNIVAESNMFTNGGPAGAGISTYGIQVGASGSAATQSIDTYKLAGQINHGTSAGQLSYSSMFDYNTLFESTGSYYFSLYRTFSNLSTENVNVTEVGFVGNTYPFDYKIMFARDVKDSNGNDINITVSPAQILTVRYNFFFPKSSGLTTNFVVFLMAEMTYKNYSLIKLINNSNVAPLASTGGPSNRFYKYAYSPGPNGINWNSIMVGSGSEPEAMENTQLSNYYLHGTGSNELLLGASITDGYTKIYSNSGSAVEFQHRRTFTNGSPNAIIVNESCQVTQNIIDSTNYVTDNTLSYKGIILRKLTGEQIIASGSSLEIVYKWMMEA